MDMTLRTLQRRLSTTAVAVQSRYRRLGGISVDDFGTGYSSLASLKQYPLDTLKIDRSFIQGIPHDGHDTALTEAIITIAHNLQLRVAAEGVELPEQQRFLQEVGCDVLQGYLHAKALPTGEIESRWYPGGSQAET